MKTAAQLIAFETRIKDLWESGDLPFLVHLCGGNESQLLETFAEVKPGDWIFSTHRAHYHYLLAGGDEAKLEKLIRDGRSMFLFDASLNFLASSILAGCACIAAGVSLALKEEGSTSRVWCFIGDGGEEQGHFYEAAVFVEANQLPCRFIIEDNDRSVDTSKARRRDNVPMLDNLFKCVQRYHYTPTYPHAGSGCKHRIEFKTAPDPGSMMVSHKTKDYAAAFLRDILMPWITR